MITQESTETQQLTGYAESIYRTLSAEEKVVLHATEVCLRKKLKPEDRWVSLTRLYRNAHTQTHTDTDAELPQQELKAAMVLDQRNISKVAVQHIFEQWVERGFVTTRLAKTQKALCVNKKYYLTSLVDELCLCGSGEAFASRPASPAQQPTETAESIYRTLSAEEKVVLHATEVCLRKKLKPEDRWVSLTRLYRNAHTQTHTDTDAELPQQELKAAMVLDQRNISKVAVQHIFEQWVERGFVTTRLAKTQKALWVNKKYYLTSLVDELCLCGSGEAFASRPASPAQQPTETAESIYRTLSAEEKVVLHATEVCLRKKLKPEDRWVSLTRLYRNAHTQTHTDTDAELPQQELKAAMVLDQRNISKVAVQHIFEQWVERGFVTTRLAKTQKALWVNKKYYLTSLVDELCLCGSGEAFASRPASPAQQPTETAESIYRTLSAEEKVVLHATEVCLRKKLKPEDRWVSLTRLYRNAHTQTHTDTDAELPQQEPKAAMVLDQRNISKVAVQHIFEQWVERGFVTTRLAKTQKALCVNKKYYLTSLVDELCLCGSGEAFASRPASPAQQPTETAESIYLTLSVEEKVVLHATDVCLRRLPKLVHQYARVNKVFSTARDPLFLQQLSPTLQRVAQRLKKSAAKQIFKGWTVRGLVTPEYVPNSGSLLTSLVYYITPLGDELCRRVSREMDVCWLRSQVLPPAVSDLLAPVPPLSAEPFTDDQLLLTPLQSIVSGMMYVKLARRKARSPRPWVDANMLCNLTTSRHFLAKLPLDVRTQVITLANAGGRACTALFVRALEELTRLRLASVTRISPRAWSTRYVQSYEGRTVARARDTRPRHRLGYTHKKTAARVIRPHAVAVRRRKRYVIKAKRKRTKDEMNLMMSGGRSD